MRLTSVLYVALSALSLAACHSQGGYFEDDPTLAYGPGCPDCPSRRRWGAYYGDSYERQPAEITHPLGGEMRMQQPETRMEPQRQPTSRPARRSMNAPAPRATAYSEALPPPRPGAPLPPPTFPRVLDDEGQAYGK